MAGKVRFESDWSPTHFVCETVTLKGRSEVTQFLRGSNYRVTSALISDVDIDDSFGLTIKFHCLSKK